MQIKLLVSAAAIALAAGVGLASADENFGTLEGISAFDSLAGIQAIPLDTDEMASVTAMLYFRLNAKTGELIPLFNGHTTHYSHYKDYGSGEKGPGHGIKYPRGGGVEDITSTSPTTPTIVTVSGDWSPSRSRAPTGFPVGQS